MIKVIKKKGRLRNCQREEETEGTSPLDVTRALVQEKDIGGKPSEI